MDLSSSQLNNDRFLLAHHTESVDEYNNLQLDPFFERYPVHDIPGDDYVIDVDGNNNAPFPSPSLFKPCPYPNPIGDDYIIDVDPNSNVDTPPADTPSGDSGSNIIGDIAGGATGGTGNTGSNSDNSGNQNNSGKDKPDEVLDTLEDVADAVDTGLEIANALEGEETGSWQDSATGLSLNEETGQWEDPTETLMDGVSSVGGETIEELNSKKAGLQAELDSGNLTREEEAAVQGELDSVRTQQKTILMYRSKVLHLLVWLKCLRTQQELPTYQKIQEKLLTY